MAGGTEQVVTRSSDLDCASPVAGGIKHLFMALLGICISSSVKCLFMVFFFFLCHFLISLLVIFNKLHAVFFYPDLFLHTHHYSLRFLFFIYLIFVQIPPIPHLTTTEKRKTVHHTFEESLCHICGLQLFSASLACFFIRVFY